MVHSAGAVLDCTAAARARRVRPGTTLAEAKAILRSDARYVEYREAEYVEERDRWLDLCLLYSSRIEHESPASAWVDLSQHPDPVDIAARLLGDVWRANGLALCAAIARSRWLAKLAALTCDPTALSLGIPDVPLIEDAAVYLSPLPTRRLSPVPAEHLARLEFLGYRRIGDVQSAPLHLLSGQFGKEGILVREAAHGRLGDPVCPNYPREVVESFRTFAGCCSDRQELLAATVEIADDLTSALRRLDALAGATETVLELESGLMLRRVRRLPKPSDALTLSLRHQVEATKVDQPVASIRIAVPDLRRVRTVQSTLEGAERREAERSAAASVRELCAMYGDSAVRQAAKIELARREQVLRAWRNANGWR